MAFFGIRFDFRNPDFAGTSMSERYAAALDMVQWADEQGVLLVVLSEHHGSEDGYLPSPLTMAAAMAARTTRIRIRLSAIVAPLHDPIRLAEDLAVVDLISGGRLDVVVTNGYVNDEFAMFGRSRSERAARTTEAVHVLRAALAGKPVEHGGRVVRVTPSPERTVPVLLGGSSEVAARRAARIADGFSPSTPDVWEFYRDECAKLGKPDPGPPLGGDPTMVHVAADPDAAWDALGRYFLYESNAYGRWMADGGVGIAGGYETHDDLAAVRASGRYRVLRPADLVAELAPNPYSFALLHPMVGGMPPADGWECLRLVEREVLPAL